MPRALISGIAGQDGSYLAEQLLTEGYEVIGFDRLLRAAESPNLVDIADHVDYVQGDLLERGSLRAVLMSAEPDEVYHLAAPTFVPESWDNPSEVMHAIAGATAELLAASLEIPKPPRIWLSASSEVFGDPVESPQNEDSSMRPRSPYGVAKLAALGLGQVMRHHHGLFVACGLLYNHESPRRPFTFLPRKVTRAAAAIALGQKNELLLGDLHAIRDWSDARDVVRGARLALRSDIPRDYVLASGHGRTVMQLVEAAFAAAGISGRVSECVRVDPQLVRPSEAVPLVGNPARAEGELGWRREITFERMIEEMVETDIAELTIAPEPGVLDDAAE
jgi:GDPmannose 4,6-dehydratase